MMVIVLDVLKLAPLVGLLIETVGGELVVAASTVTLPLIKDECGMQKYGYVPGLLKVNENVSDCARSGELHNPSGVPLVPLVDVCSVPASCIVHLTESPACTSRLEGE